MLRPLGAACTSPSAFSRAMRCSSALGSTGRIARQLGLNTPGADGGQWLWHRKPTARRSARRRPSTCRPFVLKGELLELRPCEPDFDGALRGSALTLLRENIPAWAPLTKRISSGRLPRSVRVRGEELIAIDKRDGADHRVAWFQVTISGVEPNRDRPDVPARSDWPAAATGDISGSCSTMRSRFVDGVVFSIRPTGIFLFCSERWRRFGAVRVGSRADASGRRRARLTRSAAKHTETATLASSAGT